MFRGFQQKHVEIIKRVIHHEEYVLLRLIVMVNREMSDCKNSRRHLKNRLCKGEIDHLQIPLGLFQKVERHLFVFNEILMLLGKSEARQGNVVLQLVE
jgi:hypothetical protein